MNSLCKSNGAENKNNYPFLQIHQLANHQIQKCKILTTWEKFHYDSYSNLIVLHESVHRLLHLKDAGKIKILVDVLQLNNKQIGKVNELRKQCNNYTI